MDQATIFMGVPTYFSRLLASPLATEERCSTIRLFISGSAPLSRHVFRSFQQRTGHEIVERYGMTESGGTACNPIHGPRKLGSIGIPLPGFTLRVADDFGNEVREGAVGELQMRGGSVFPGYWNRPEETSAAFTADGYLRSGDLARKYPDGSYEIVGRAKDIIISNGENINPLEVEAALDACPGVSESAVIGIPDAAVGESVVAVVVPSNTGELLHTENILNDLKARMKRQLAYYKVPRRIILRTTLPRNAMGKIQKNILKSDPRLQAPADQSGT
jgi:malonyl-CoA/methylmalonyl-CoA synthetase